MEIINKVEVIKHFRQSVIKSGNKDFFLRIEQEFQRLKIMTRAAVFEKDPEIWYG